MAAYGTLEYLAGRRVVAHGQVNSGETFKP